MSACGPSSDDSDEAGSGFSMLAIDAPDIRRLGRVGDECDGVGGLLAVVDNALNDMNWSLLFG